LILEEKHCRLLVGATGGVNGIDPAAVHGRPAAGLSFTPNTSPEH